MYLSILSLLLIISLIGTAFLMATYHAFRSMILKSVEPEAVKKFFFYHSIHNFFFSKQQLQEGFLFAILSGLNLTRFVYAISSLLLVWILFHTLGLTILFLFISLMLLFIIGEYLPRVIGVRFPEKTINFCAPLSSLFMTIAFPITFLSVKLFPSHYRSIYFDAPQTRTKREILDILQRTEVSSELDHHEKKIIESVIRFKDRIAREIMVPRVDVFSLSASTTIREAARLIEEEGYSRIPVYRNTVDNIVGVLMYKDILNQFREYVEKDNEPTILDAPIEKIQKGILYTPETKKISDLLLEFRRKQVHLAIVVDEYGGTEGVVSIEDILEEIVGEIADEYDEEEELFFSQPDGSWIVDARMSIIDLEQQLGIRIPQEGDYDTLGGYIFHCTGSIPSKGFVIHKEDFQLEILRSDERRVERVRIKPITKEDVESKDETRYDEPEESKKESP